MDGGGDTVEVVNYLEVIRDGNLGFQCAPEEGGELFLRNGMARTLYLLISLNRKHWGADRVWTVEMKWGRRSLMEVQLTRRILSKENTDQGKQLCIFTSI